MQRDEFALAPSSPATSAPAADDTESPQGLRRSLFVYTLIVEGLWSVCLAATSLFAYLNTTVPGTDGASILPLTAEAMVFGAMTVVSLVNCWQTARRGVRSEPLWWVAAILVGEILILLALALPAAAVVHAYFSGDWLTGHYRQ